jgi:hypothetical protein
VPRVVRVLRLRRVVLVTLDTLLVTACHSSKKAKEILDRTKYRPTLFVRHKSMWE